MRGYARAISGMSRRQKLALAAIVLLVVLTWMAVCLVVVGVIGP